MDINIDVTQPEQVTPIELEVSTGVSYPILDKKPQINGVELVGDKTAEELGLATKEEVNLKQDKLVAGENITILNNVISSKGGGVSDAYTKAETNTLLNGKQDKGNYALKSEIPTKTSQLTNNSGFVTQHQDISHLATKTELANKQDKGDYALKSEIPNISNLATKGELDSVVEDLDEKASIQFAKNASFVSTQYVDLTLGKTGTTYTAPANGCFYLQKTCGLDYGWIVGIVNDIQYTEAAFNTSTVFNSLIPCLKGEIVDIRYHTTGEIKKFRFYYAKGEVNE